MKAGWLFAKNKVAGPYAGTVEAPNAPALPHGVAGKWTCPGDVIRLTGPAAAPHIHLLTAGVALPDDNLGDGHRHYVLRVGDTWHQATIGTPDHSHTLNIGAGNNLVPDWFLLFWFGSDEDALAIAQDPDCHIVVQAVIDFDEDTQTYSFEELDDTPWSAAETNAWQTRALNILGLQLPAECDRGKRLVQLFLGALLSRQTPQERPYRYSSGVVSQPPLPAAAAAAEAETLGQRIRSWAQRFADWTTT